MRYAMGASIVLVLAIDRNKKVLKSIEYIHCCVSTSATNGILHVVHMSAVGFEPTRSCLQWILSPALTTRAN